MQQQVAPIQEGNFLIITDRICSDNIQPQVHKGDIYVIDRQLTLPTGNVTVLCHRPSEPKKVFRINDRRFQYKIATAKMIQEAKRRALQAKAEETRKFIKEGIDRSAKHTARILATEFSWKENVQIAVLPLIINELAFIFTERARRYGAEHHIAQLRPLSRSIIALRQEYQDFITHDLDYRRKTDLTRYAEEFLSEPMIQKNVLLISLTLANELRAQNPQLATLERKDEHIDLRVLSTIGLLFIEAYRRQIAKANRIIAAKANGRITPSIEDPIITDRLHACLVAMQSPFQLKQPSTHVTTFNRIIDNQLQLIQVIPA